MRKPDTGPVKLPLNISCSVIGARKDEPEAPATVKKIATSPARVYLACLLIFLIFVNVCYYLCVRARLPEYLNTAAVCSLRPMEDALRMNDGGR